MSIDLLGTQVKEMFPSTKTKTINKLITENSLTRLLNRLLDVDSYIITSEYPNTISLNKAYDSITVSDEISDVDLEFNIHGYYFNLNTYSNVISLIQSEYDDLQAGDEIKAIIYVDDFSNPDYPELYGQEGLEKITDSVEENSYKFTFPKGCTIDNVSNITLYNNQEVVDVSDYHYEVNDDNKLIIKDSNENIVDVIYNKISYILSTSISSIKLYKSPNKPNKPYDDLKEYELTLFKMKNSSTFTIPLSSIHRFSSLAIESIDGGEIPQS